jgi:betaine-aldehyde dehydrogenase
MILKPSKEAPLSAFILADILDEIGLPAGVFNLVSGHGSEIGNYMSSHPDVDMVSFTGSTGAGVSVSQSAAPTIKRVTLELGGKSANVALDDSDPILVAKKAIGACHQNSGQTCSALTRLIIPEEMNEQICEIIAVKNDSYLVGNPLDETTRCGPMVSSRQQSSVTEYIQSGINEGATLISGGLGMPDGVDKGFYVKPTIFANVTPNMRIWKEEIFGPVLVITTYKNESEALSLANDSIYGLSGGVWSASNERAIEFAKKMRTGQVSINGGAFNVSAPFGGYKLSGNGRELGTHGLDEFLEIKSIQM